MFKTSPSLKLVQMQTFTPSDYRLHAEKDSVVGRIRGALGCCGLIEFSRIYYNRDADEVSIDNGFNFAEKKAFKMGYSGVFYTVKASQKLHIKVLKARGWVPVFNFVNRLTTADIILYVKELKGES